MAHVWTVTIITEQPLRATTHVFSTENSARDVARSIDNFRSQNTVDGLTDVFREFVLPQTGEYIEVGNYTLVRGPIKVLD